MVLTLIATIFLLNLDWSMAWPLLLIIAGGSALAGRLLAGEKGAEKNCR